MTIDPARLLDGMDLVVFDKDGTLIDFHLMWDAWTATLVDRLGPAAGDAVHAAMHAAMGTDPHDGAAAPVAPLPGSIMARLRAVAVAVLRAHGTPEPERVVDAVWVPPDAIRSARPLTDLPALFRALAGDGRRIGVVTADDRLATTDTLVFLGVDRWVEALVCADDGLPLKPAPDMFLRACAELGVPPSRAAMVGDTPADLLMGRAAGAGLVIGVLSGAGDRSRLAPHADGILGSVADLCDGPALSGAHHEASRFGERCPPRTGSPRAAG